MLETFATSEIFEYNISIKIIFIENIRNTLNYH